MSRYNPNRNTQFLYEAAEHWRNTCLLQDGSVFTDKELWTRENLNDDFLRKFIECVTRRDFSDVPSFLGKLVKQLKAINASPEIYQLMAEVLWIMLLGSSGLNPNKRKENAQRLWSESDTELPEHKYFQEEYGKGIANPGMGFQKYLWLELIVFILFVVEIKNMSIDQRKRLLTNNDGKEISLRWEEWVKQWDEQWREYYNLRSDNRQIRHMILHLLFPDYFERAFSVRPKRRIVRALRGKEAAKKSRTELDETLRAIRAEKEEQYGTKEIDFFAPPLHNEWGDQSGDEEDDGEIPIEMSNLPLNLIFYGPPGTGKTYRTINAALQILDPEFYEENSEEREQLRDRYEKLKEEGQIAFVTFHQSFGYEEFVEGIRPLMGDEVSEQVFYEIKDGVFKRICESATSVKPSFPFEEAVEKLKEECSEDLLEMETVARRKKHQVWYKEGDKSFITKPMEGIGPDAIPVRVSIKTIKDFYEHPDRVKGTRARMIFNYLKEKYDLDKTQSTSEHKNYVLIIDEINRGNISRIFGELITLIEKSKRLGETEATTATLPYSGEPFGVPNNLYIIGTMNTADRSIALLDTALRRRFRFEEMMPKYGALNDINVGEVNIGELLKTMNERIEALYDRDHQIGHSYFLPLKDSPDVETLKDIFLHEILPLLQEYFYDDWAKIDAVLNSNQFLDSNNPTGKIKNKDLFDPDKKLWFVKEESFDQISNYQKIYKDTEDAEADNSS